MNDSEQVMLPGNNSVAILLAAKKPFRVDSIVEINSRVTHCADAAVAVKTKGIEEQSMDEFWALWEEITEDDRNRTLTVQNDKHQNEGFTTNKCKLKADQDKVEFRAVEKVIRRQVDETGCSVSCSRHRLVWE